MSTAQCLRALLEPLGVYQWDGSMQGAELAGVGAAVDLCLADLDLVQREMNLTTAQGEGLERICLLLPSRPASGTVEQLRAALAALLRIGDESFTPAAINDNLAGCGIPATVTETGVPGQVEIRFPKTAGIPDNFSVIQGILEGILPAHLELLYVFWYLTWKRLQQTLPSWRVLQSKGFTWKTLERFVVD